MSAPIDQELEFARRCARGGRFDEVLAACRKVLQTAGADAAALLDVGALLLDCGLLGAARECFEAARRLSPRDLGPICNLAIVARDAGEQARSRALYAQLTERFPNHPVIRRNALVCLEYDPEVSDRERVSAAAAWGAWATALAGGPHPRPPRRTARARPLRIGYVSADFCQHTVGLFVKGVLQTHDRSRVEPFAYSAGPANDWVTAAVRRACVFREVAALDDAALAAQIRADEIDVLVDLSGHTGGSRLTAFAHRPAPVMVSWLGYFATTGLECMDAVLLDEWHAPPGTESQFVEPVVRLAGGRFCYEPVPWAPSQVSAPPLLRNGCVTFGCFNNTAKLNAGVYDLWAQVLQAVPDSRLVLKWRTFNDDGLRQKVQDEFRSRGVVPGRLELRGPSFHAEVLKQYADIDIALDPFPFTGGLTSCEALWMGVPVVTWPQGKVVSRQTFAFLGAIGLTELAAGSAGEYVQIAASLARDPQRLQHLRATMRARMGASPLMDVAGFTRMLEDALIALHASSTAPSAPRKPAVR